MLTVNELSIKSDTPAHVVRYYVRIGLIQPAAAGERYRLFRLQDVAWIRFIRLAKHLGFTFERDKADYPTCGMSASPL